MENKETNKPKVCCLCGRNEKLAGLMFDGIKEGTYVCASCIKYANGILDEIEFHKSKEQEDKEYKEKLSEMFAQCPKPTKLKEMLDEYVIGQDDAKITISTAVYNHYKRIAQNIEDDVEIEHSNILIAGQSGTGKTLILKTLAKLIGIPLTIVDATKFTESGYVGEDVESMVSRLFQLADYDPKKTELGIIVIDEGDKLGRKSENPSITRDVSGEGVQQGLLKIIEGSKVLISPKGGRKHPEAPVVEIDTSNILFVFMGAFDGIEKKIASRLNTRSVGFKTGHEDTGDIDRDNLMQYMTHQDVRAFGIIPELIGRLPVLTTLTPLDKDALIRILNEPKNAIIKQYKKLFAMDGITLTFDDDVFDLIAEKALECKLGARSLRTMVEAVLRDEMFRLPGTDVKTLHITREYAEQKLKNSVAIKAQQLNSTGKLKKTA